MVGVGSRFWVQKRGCDRVLSTQGLHVFDGFISGGFPHSGGVGAVNRVLAVWVLRN